MVMAMGQQITLQLTHLAYSLVLPPVWPGKTSELRDLTRGSISECASLFHMKYYREYLEGTHTHHSLISLRVAQY